MCKSKEIATVATLPRNDMSFVGEGLDPPIVILSGGQWPQSKDPFLYGAPLASSSGNWQKSKIFD